MATVERGAAARVDKDEEEEDAWQGEGIATLRAAEATTIRLASVLLVRGRATGASIDEEDGIVWVSATNQ